MKTIFKHKVLASFLILLSLFGGYYAFNKLTDSAETPRYILASVEHSTIITTVTGSGQVSPLNQVDIKSKVSGDISSVNVLNGASVKAGSIIAVIDSKDSERSIRDAEISLDSAKIALEKMKLAKSPLKSEADISKAYDDGFNAISNAFLDLPGIMSGFGDILFTNSISSNQWNIDYYFSTVRDYSDLAEKYKSDTQTAYDKARIVYDKTFANYKATSRFASRDSIESLINETYETTKVIAEAVKNANNLIQFYQDELIKHNPSAKPNTLSNTHLTSLSSYTSKTNSHLLNLLNIKETIKDNIDASTNNALDLRSEELSLLERENSLSDAKDKLEDYTIRSPFDGAIAKINVKKSDSIGSGANVATLITKEKLAEISLNEIDVAKVQVGQKVNLTFDAIDTLNITGKVSEIDTVGSVSQGVVTYGIKITFDTNDDRIKPGMSVSASIITEVKRDVLAVPAGAIKTRGDMRYVEVLDNPIPPQKSANALESLGVTSANSPRVQIVEVGLSNDVSVEISSGLKAGDSVISRTILPAKATAQTTSASSLFGGNTSGNRTGNVRVTR